MTIQTLKSKIAAFLQAAPADFVINGVDLLLDAINHTHHSMQLIYDFKYSEISVDALVSLSNGVPISPLPIHGTSTMVSVKKVLRAWISDNFGGERPIKFWGRDTQAADTMQRWAGIPVPFAPVQRDMPSYPTFYESYIVQRGSTLMMYPSAQVVFPQDPFPVFLDVIRYFPDYMDTDDDVDFILQFGHDFLFWSSVVDLNVIRKEFVPRQEGNVPSPTDLRDEAWKEFLAWDAQVITTGDSAVSLD